MASAKISALPAAATLGGTEVVPGVQSSANVKITIDQIKAWVSASMTFNRQAALTGAVDATNIRFPTSHPSGAPWAIWADSTDFGGADSETDALFGWGFNTLSGGNKIVNTGGVGGARKFYFQMEHDYYQAPGNSATRLDEWHLNAETDAGAGQRLFQVSYFPSNGSVSTAWSGSFSVFASGSLSSGDCTLIASSGVIAAKNGAFSILKADGVTPLTALSLNASDVIIPGAAFDMRLFNVSLDSGLNNGSSRPAVGTSLVPGEIWGRPSSPGVNNDGFLRLSAGGDTGTPFKSYIDLSGFSSVADMDRTIVFGAAGVAQARITSKGLGVGTATLGAALDVQKAVTAESSAAIGARFKQTLTAIADGDILTSLYIDTTFVPGAFATTRDLLQLLVATASKFRVDYTGAAYVAGNLVKIGDAGGGIGGIAFASTLTANNAALIGSATETQIGVASSGTILMRINNDAGGNGQFAFSSGKIAFSALHLEVGEITAPASPAVNKFRLYAEDNGGGLTRAVLKFSDGSTVVLGTQAA